MDDIQLAPSARSRDVPDFDQVPVTDGLVSTARHDERRRPGRAAARLLRHAVRMATSLILASASPRRQELLRSIGLVFDVEPADVDESELPGEPAIAYVERVALAKADAIARRRECLDGLAILAADTTVDVDGEILAKPSDDDDARRMLRLLAGRPHSVHTSVVCRYAGGAVATTVTTGVTFAPLTDADIDWYLGLGEHVDKAGAYGMQGAASAFVERLDGSPSNVIGLPLAQTIPLLRACGVLVATVRPGASAASPGLVRWPGQVGDPERSVW